jgi:hypothetical protein
MGIKRFVLRSVGLPGTYREPDLASGGHGPTSGGRLPMRVLRSGALSVAATVGLMAGGALALADAAPAGASPALITVNCPTDNLQYAINSASPGSKIQVNGTCTGNFYIQNDVTLSGPATLDGGGIPTTIGTTLNVISGTVVLNNIVIQDGVGIDNLGGGVWNSGQLTLNHSTVTHNTAGVIGGVFNVGQLTLNGSSVSHNTATAGDAGGIFNCGANPGFQAFGLCTGPPSILTLNNSSVSNNTTPEDGGGIWNDPQAVTTLNGSTVSGNTAGGNGAGIANQGAATLNLLSVVSNNTASNDGGGIWNGAQGVTTLSASVVSGNTAVADNGGGIENHGTANLDLSTVSGNTAGAGGGIENNGTATLNLSALLNNASTAGSEFIGGGGGIANGLSNTGSTTLNYSLVRGNTAAFVGGGVFAGGGPVEINHTIVTGNSADTSAGGMIVWDGPITVTDSAFSNNSDPGLILHDTLPGVLVAPANYLGPGSNNPTFTTTHSTYN